MPTELVVPKDVSSEMLFSLFESAYMDASLDDDGDVIVIEGYRMFITVQAEGKRICITSYFAIDPSSSITDRLLYVNDVNYDLVLIRAYVAQETTIVFDYTVMVDGGISKKTIVSSLKLFRDILATALKKDENGVIA